MSKPKSDGGPAFPVLAYDHSIAGDIRPQPTIYDGMSLRDYFAAAALQGFAFLKVYTQTNPNANSYEELARCSYELADAMLKERSKP